MCVEKEEVGFCTINFISKTSHHEKFDSWDDIINAQVEMKK